MCVLWWEEEVVAMMAMAVIFIIGVGDHGGGGDGGHCCACMHERRWWWKGGGARSGGGNGGHGCHHACVHVWCKGGGGDSGCHCHCACVHSSGGREVVMVAVIVVRVCMVVVEMEVVTLMLLCMCECLLDMHSGWDEHWTWVGAGPTIVVLAPSSLPLITSSRHCVVDVHCWCCRYCCVCAVVVADAREEGGWDQVWCKQERLLVDGTHHCHHPSAMVGLT